MPDTVEDAIKFFREDKATTAIAQLSYEELLATHLQLLESSNVLANYADASAEKPKAHEKQRITARVLFRLGGSATGPESKAMAQANHVETQAEKEDNAAKREEKKKKKAAEVASAIIQGEKVLQALELNGEAQLNVLTLADINALLINADPQGTGPKPKTKKEGLLRVRALSTALAALERRALALAARVSPAIPIATPAPASPNMPPPPPFPFPFIEPFIGVFRSSVGSFGSSGEVEQPVAPVGLHAL
jgi:hypothetical protein